MLNASARTLGLQCRLHWMVTAAGSATERVLGLETAADDYVVKPFEPIELTARIKAVLRRIAPSLKVEKDRSASMRRVLCGW